MSTPPEPEPPAPPLTLESLPDDLLRRCLRAGRFHFPYVTHLEDILSFASCCRRFRNIVYEGKVVEHVNLHIVDWEKGTGADPASDPPSDPLGLHRSLWQNIIVIAANSRSLEWISSWPLLRAPFFDKGSLMISIESRGDAAADPALPAAWGRLAAALDRAGNPLHVPVSTTSTVGDKGVLYGTLDWLRGVSSLRELGLTISAREDLNSQRPGNLAPCFERIVLLPQLTKLSISCRDDSDDEAEEGGKKEEAAAGAAAATAAAAAGGEGAAAAEMEVEEENAVPAGGAAAATAAAEGAEAAAAEMEVDAAPAGGAEEAAAAAAAPKAAAEAEGAKPPFRRSSLAQMLSKLGPLTALQALDFDGLELTRSEYAPLSALSSLTALTLPLHHHRKSLAPLPPGLQTLSIYLQPEEDDGDLTGQWNDVQWETRAVVLTLSAPNARRVFARTAAGASLRSLHITVDLQIARNAYYTSGMVKEDDEPPHFIVRLSLSRDSLPCAFPGLEEFSFALEEAYNPQIMGRLPQMVDFVALFRAAPRLRTVRLKGIHEISYDSLQWLMRRRPGFRIDTERVVGVWQRVIHLQP
jgi:hypothetical protein